MGKKDASLIIKNIINEEYNTLNINYFLKHNHLQDRFSVYATIQ